MPPLRDSRSDVSWAAEKALHGVGKVHITSKISTFVANYTSLNACKCHAQNQRTNSVECCSKKATLSLFLPDVCEQRASVWKSIHVLAFTWLWPKEWDCQYKQNKVTSFHKVSRSSKEERLGLSLSASLWRLFRNITLETDLGVDPGEEITVHVSSNLCVSWETLERRDIWNTLFKVI